MHGAALVKRIERRRDLIDNAEQLGDRHVRVLDLAPIDGLLEALALDELHDEVRVPVGVTEVEDLDEVRMMNSREQRGLAPQVLHQLLVLSELGPQHLDRDGPLEGEVIGALDDTHATSADLVANAIRAAEGPADLDVR